MHSFELVWCKGTLRGRPKVNRKYDNINREAAHFHMHCKQNWKGIKESSAAHQIWQRDEEKEWSGLTRSKSWGATPGRYNPEAPWMSRRTETQMKARDLEYLIAWSTDSAGIWTNDQNSGDWICAANQEWVRESALGLVVVVVQVKKSPINLRNSSH